MPHVTNEALLRIIFGERRKEAHVTAFAGDPKQGAWKGWRAGQRPELLERADLNTFYVVSLFTGADRSVAAFDGLYVVILDDVGVKADRTAVLATLGAPTYRLETSPGNEQWGYCLEVPETDRGRAEAVLNELARQELTDPGAKDVARYGRLPVGTNGKPAYGPGGFRHVVRELAPARRFTPDGLMWALGGVLPLPGAAQAAQPQKLLDPAAAAQDAVLASMTELGVVQGLTPNKWGYQCVCPCVDGHTGRDETGCAYRPGGWGRQGVWKCHHGSCAKRDWRGFMDGLDKQLVAAGLPRMIEQEFRDADKAALDTLWDCLARGEKPKAAEYAALAFVPKEDVERVLRPAPDFFGTKLAPIKAALARARWRIVRRFALLPCQDAGPVPLPAGYQAPVSMDEARAAMDAALAPFDALIAAGAGTATARLRRHRQGRSW